jgi:hypothetical protein
LSQNKAKQSIKIASDVVWFLYSAIVRGDEQHATVTAACAAWAAKHMPGRDSTEHARHVQNLWRRYRPVAHLCAAYRAFLAERVTGYIHMLAVGEALLDRLEIRVRTAPHPLLERQKAWVVPTELGLLRAELHITPAEISRL